MILLNFKSLMIIIYDEYNYILNKFSKLGLMKRLKDLNNNHHLQ